MKPVLTWTHIVAASQDLDCEADAVRAVALVETRSKAFLADGRPNILFERHKFHQFTQGRYAEAFPGISNPVPGGYGASGAWQHERLGLAAGRDREAALKSASWGMFQIMGFNHALADHSTIQRFVNAMYAGEPEHLAAFVALIKNDRRKHPATRITMAQALRAKDWASFAYLYNGSDYRTNQYDTKMATEYRNKGNNPWLT